MEISVVVPVYGCSKHLINLHNRLIISLKEITKDFEIIMINDGSYDNAWDTIKEIANNDKKVMGVNLSRNFGQHYAISAGLNISKGNWIVVMDCDLQDRPENIPILYKEAQKGYDIVFAQRKLRKDTFFKKLFSKLFYLILSYLTRTKLDPTIANFGIYNRKSINAVLLMKDKLKYFSVMIRWVGFNSTKMSIQHDKREIDETSYSFSKLISLAIDVMLSFSDKPLRLMVKFGFFLSSFSILFALYILYRALFGAVTVVGWASTIISIWFLGGIIIMFIGIIGIYIGKTFDQTKDRPVYIIKDIIND